MKRITLFALFLLLVLPLSASQAQTENTWPMAGANPQRTSWTPEEIRGRMFPLWAVSLEPFIPYANQMIAAYDTIYVSTAKGLYALNSETGALRWVFPTELPLGHSPTVADGVVYVGGYDHYLYALNAYTGQQLWVYEAENGFATNPLVVEGKVILGNRDGDLYAVNTDGTLAWRFPTNGPILFSAAYKDGVVYFASNDAYAYAVYTNGTQKWKSPKLPGGGFYSYWPVIYTKDGHDYVVLGGSYDYTASEGLTIGSLMNGLDKEALYAGISEGGLVGPTGTEPGDWASGTVTIDDSRAAEYLEQYPSRRRVFVLDTANGQEYTFDSDGDGNPEYAPVTWFGTHGGDRYPAVVGSDGVLYQSNSYVSNPYIPQGGPSGWKFGSEYISRVHAGTYGAVDEPMSLSGGGDILYYGWMSGFRGMGAYDISIPYGQPARVYYYGGGSYPAWLLDECPNADAQVGTGPWAGPEVTFYTAGGTFGVYCTHGNQNPPIPYNGKIYFHTMNAVFALSADPPACQVTSQPAFDADSPAMTITKDDLRQKLALEIQKIIAAGHLRPGYYHGTIGTNRLSYDENSYMVDYFHNPAETFITLIDALPHLSSELQQQVRTYLQNEWALYGDKVHIGWRDGAARETFTIPPEIQANMNVFGPKTTIPNSSWDYRYSLYGRWRYIKEFGDQSLAVQVFAQIRNTISINPPEQDSQQTYFYYSSYIKNAYIAGYIGYIEIGRMAGIAEAELAPYVAELNRLLAERADEFSTDQPVPDRWAVILTVARNFMFMTPELAEYLQANAYTKVQQALNSYDQVAPYWFVSKYDGTSDEGVLHPLYDYSALFKAKALIMQEPFDELVKWLDVPAFERGDLFYIQNLILTLGTPSTLPSISKTASNSTARMGEVLTYTITARDSDAPLTQAVSMAISDTLPTGLVYYPGLCASSWGNSPTCSPQSIHWQGALSSTIPIVISYTARTTVSQPTALTNEVQVDGGAWGYYTSTVTIIANPLSIYLPLILKAH